MKTRLPLSIKKWITDELMNIYEYTHSHDLQEYDRLGNILCTLLKGRRKNLKFREVTKLGSIIEVNYLKASRKFSLVIYQNPRKYYVPR